MRQTITNQANVSVSRIVKKVKLTKSKMLDVNFEETATIVELIDGEEKIRTFSSNITREGKNIVHDDMQSALLLLRTHLAFLCDQVEAQNKDFYVLDDDQESLERYKVNSYSIGGSDIHEGVTLSGVRIGRGGAPLNLNSPFTKWEAGEHEDSYSYAFELRSLIVHCNEEALLYVEGKIAPDYQGNLFEQEDGSEAEEYE